MRPLARTEDVIIEHIGDETIAFDKKHQKAHCLNKAAFVVWQHCDGRNSVNSLARLLPQGCDLPADRDLVLLALRQLKTAGLLDEKTPTPSVGTRRELAKRVALLGVTSVPVITSILAPTPAMASSGDQNNNPQGNPPPDEGSLLDQLLDALGL
jgi:hypothetical protein